MKYVYKVVSEGHYDKRMKSMVVSDKSDLCLTYAIGEKTTPKVGKIFAFNKLLSARRFAPGSTVLYCKATGVKKPNFNYVPDIFLEYFKDVKIFWKTLAIGSMMRLPIAKGTVLCDSITPIRICKSRMRRKK